MCHNQSQEENPNRDGEHKEACTREGGDKEGTHKEDSNKDEAHEQAKAPNSIKKVPSKKPPSAT